MLRSVPVCRIVTFVILAACTLVFTDSCTNSGITTARVLVFSKSEGWQHGSIPAANAAIYKLGTENGFGVDTTQDAELFTDENLKNYHAVVFANTTRDVLNAKQQAAFERYIQAGQVFKK